MVQKLRELYLGLACTCTSFIVINNVTTRYNATTWCVGQDYEHAVAHADEKGIFRHEIHLVLTLLNLICYSATFAAYKKIDKVYSKAIFRMEQS